MEMTCAGCSGAAERVLNKLGGINNLILYYLVMLMVKKPTDLQGGAAGCHEVIIPTSVSKV